MRLLVSMLVLESLTLVGGLYLIGLGIRDGLIKRSMFRGGKPVAENKAVMAGIYYILLGVFSIGIGLHLLWMWMHGRVV